MADGAIKIEVKGLKELQAAIAKFPKQVEIYMVRAGQEAAKRAILPTEGLQKYPHPTSANSPPTPYYIRGRGMQYKSKNTLSSERLGTQWYVMHRSTFKTAIGSRASYAKYVHDDEEQATFMAPKGWRKLKEVAEAKLPQISKVFNAWVDKLLKDIKLK